MRVTLLLIVALAACGPVGRDVDPMSAVDNEDVGLPVLSFRWKRLLAQYAKDPNPQEFASAAEHDGRLYVGSHQGTFYALQALDGSVVWSKRLGSVSSRPLIDGEGSKVYVGTDDGALVCLDTFDGRENWRYATRGPIFETPTFTSDVIVVSNEADQVTALDRQSGKFRWQYRSETPDEFTLRGHGGVSVAGELIFAGFANGTVVALRQATGSVAWMTSVRGDAERFVDVDSTPVVLGEVVYVASSGGGLFALDRTTGFVRWQLPIENAASVVTDGRRLYVGAADSGVYAVDLRGHVVWRQGTRGAGEPAPPVLAGDYLIVSLADDGMFISDKRTGTLHQYFDPGGGISASPTLGRSGRTSQHDLLYVMSNAGFLYAMSVKHFD